jgi:hypothetical protein
MGEPAADVEKKEGGRASSPCHYPAIPVTEVELPAACPPMLGQLGVEPELVDCEPELVCVPVDVDVVVVLVAAKAIPTEDNAATAEMASIE